MSEPLRWQIRENASVPVLVSLALRHLLGIHQLGDLPPLRGVPARVDGMPAASASLEAQWRSYWDMTIEPEAHPSPVPLELVDGFDTVVALPTRGAETFRAAIARHAHSALSFARSVHSTYSRSIRGASEQAYHAYAGAIAAFERDAGRQAQSFDLTVEVLPFTEHGIWWVGANTVAVSDDLRDDAEGFNRALRPVIAELA